MELLVLGTARPSVVLPALELLPHRCETVPADVPRALSGRNPDAVLVDARAELVAARGACRLLRATGLIVPMITVLTEGGLAAVSADWEVDDVLLNTAGPAEIETRLKLSIGRLAARSTESTATVRAGDLSIDPDTYTARLRGKALDLTYKEFELLRHLAQHPGRVFTREQLLQEVWGYDYFGGLRTVDVHVRRLRAKLGAEHESMIGTVRQVGYKFVTPARAAATSPPETGRNPQPTADQPASAPDGEG